MNNILVEQSQQLFASLEIEVFKMPNKRTWMDYGAVEHFLTEEIETDENAVPMDLVKHYLEAFYCLCEAEDWERAYQILIVEIVCYGHKKSLARHLYEWSYHEKLYKIYNKLLGKLPINEEAIIWKFLAGYYLYRGQYEKAVEFCEKSLAIFKQEEYYSEYQQTRILNNLGSIYTSLVKYVKAKEFYHNSLEIALKLPEKEWQADILSNIGTLEARLGNYQTARDYYQKSLRLYQETDDLLGKADVLANLGQLECSNKQYDKAIDFLESSLRIAKNIHASLTQEIILYNLALVNHETGGYETAIQLYQNCIASCRKTRNFSLLLLSLKNLGNSYSVLGEYNQAHNYYFEALSWAEYLQKDYDKAGILDYIITLYENQNEYSNVIEYCQKYLELAKIIDDLYLQFYILGRLIAVYHKLQEFETALDYCQESLKIAEKIEDKQRKSSALINLGYICLDLQRYDSAVEYYQEALNIYRDIFDNSDYENQEIALKDIEIALKNIGYCYCMQSEYNQAIEAYTNLFNLYENTQNHQGKLEALGFLAWTEFQLQNYQQVIKHSQHILELPQENENNFYRVYYGYYYQGKALMELQNFVQGLELFEQAYPLLLEIQVDIAEFKDDCDYVLDTYQDLLDNQIKERLNLLIEQLSHS